MPYPREEGQLVSSRPSTAKSMCRPVRAKPGSKTQLVSIAPITVVKSLAPVLQTEPVHHPPLCEGPLKGLHLCELHPPLREGPLQGPHLCELHPLLGKILYKAPTAVNFIPHHVKVLYKALESEEEPRSRSPKEEQQSISPTEVPLNKALESEEEPQFRSPKEEP